MEIIKEEGKKMERRKALASISPSPPNRRPTYTQMPRFNFGMDLMSINVHRGRDHGIATYNDMRVVCGLPRAQSFRDITDQIPQSVSDCFF